MRCKLFNFLCLFPLLLFLNVTVAEEIKTRKFFAIQEMVNMVQNNEDVFFRVMSRQAIIDGKSYLATTLPVSRWDTFNIAQTNEGVEWYVLCSSQILPKVVSNGKACRNSGNKVKLTVLLDDIYLIFGVTKSHEQITLYSE